jgi:hypothetical protein
MIVLTAEAVAVLHRQQERQAAREDRMRNALEILSTYVPHHEASPRAIGLFVNGLAREGLGREAE